MRADARRHGNQSSRDGRLSHVIPQIETSPYRLKIGEVRGAMHIGWEIEASSGAAPYR